MKALHRGAALAAAAGLVVGGLTGCSATFGPAGSPIFRINGSCTTKGGTLHGIGSGFSESTTYETTVTNPDGSLYNPKGYAHYGNTSEFGTIDNWPWPCKGDSAGTYTAAIKDTKTGKTVKVKFTIG